MPPSATRAIVSLSLLTALGVVAPVSAQQSTGQLLIAAGFNPIAAVTPQKVSKLMSLPANQFVLRQKGGRDYYVYADPAGCNCAYVGSAAAMRTYQARLDASAAGSQPDDSSLQPSDSGLEQNMISSMDSDDASAQFNNDVFGPDF